MKSPNQTRGNEHPIIRAALAAAIALPLATATAIVPAQPAQALNFQKTLKSDETFEHTAHDDSIDIYEYTAPKRGYVRLQFEVTEVTDDNNTSVRYSIRKNGLAYDSGWTRLSDGEGRTSRIPVSKGDKLEIRVDSTYDNGEVAYRVRVVTLMPDGLETEPNDTKKEANNLKLGQIRAGLTDIHDRDFFEHDAGSDGLYSFRLKLSNETSYGAALVPSICIDDGSFTSLENYYGRAMANVRTVPAKKGQTLFVSLRSSFYELFYYIQVTRKTIPTPQVKSLSAKRKAAAVTWSKTSKHADGYQVRWSTSKSMKDAKTKLVSGVSKTSATLGKLKPKKRYYVQVRACYVDYDRATGWNKQYHFFSWSKAKSVKAK